MVPRVVSMLRGAFGEGWQSGERQGGGADVDAGVDLDPGLAARLDGGDQDVLGRWRGRGRAGRRGVEHGLPPDLARAGRGRDAFGEDPRLDPAGPRRPSARVDLAVLGLELGPADHTFGGIEPEAPLRRVGRGDLVDAAEEAALV